MAEDKLELAQAFARSHPAEAEKVLGQHPTEVGTGFLEAVDRGIRAGLLNAMLPPTAATHLGAMRSEDVAALVAQMSVQRAAGVIRILPPDLGHAAMAAQSTVRRSQIQFYLRQVKGVIGAWIESDVVAAHANDTVEGLVKRFSVYEGDLAQAYIVDAEQTVRGAVNAATLVAAPPEMLASELMRPVPGVLRARTPIEIAVTDEAWRKADVLPVAEAGGEFLGVIRYVTLRHAVDDLADQLPSGARGSSALGLADAWFLGMSDILSASMGQPTLSASADGSLQGEPS
jgi:Mg/Co/Ni transporter MgtE